MLLLLVSQSVLADEIDTAVKWAWGTNIGWLNLNAAPDDAVMVFDDHLEGYIYSENVGWIRVGTHTSGSTHTYANNSNTDYGVNHDNCGNLSGYGWGTNIGWVNFDPTGAEGVTIDIATGDFDGYAWSENVGWLHLQGTISPTYKVNTTWRADPLDVLTPTIAAVGTDLHFNWTAVPEATAYNIYHAENNAYFTPTTPLSNTIATSWSDPNRVGIVGQNHYYIIQATSGCLDSPQSIRVGEFDFTLESSLTTPPPAS